MRAATAQGFTALTDAGAAAPRSNATAADALTSVAANLAAIFGGIIVFHDSIGSGTPAITARILAFCLVIAGAALMPAPMRATPTRASTTSRATSQGDPRDARPPVPLLQTSGARPARAPK